MDTDNIISDKHFVVTKLLPPHHQRTKTKTKTHKKLKRGSKRRKNSNAKAENPVFETCKHACNINIDRCQTGNSFENVIPLSPDCKPVKKFKLHVWDNKKPVDFSIKAAVHKLPTKSGDYKKSGFHNTMITKNKRTVEKRIWFPHPNACNEEALKPVSSEHIIPRANRKTVRFRSWVDVVTPVEPSSPPPHTAPKKVKRRRKVKRLKIKKGPRLPEWNFSTKLCDSATDHKTTNKRKYLNKKCRKKFLTGIPKIKAGKVLHHKHSNGSFRSSSVLAANAITYLRKNINRRRRVVKSTDTNLKHKFVKKKQVKKKVITKPKSIKIFNALKINENSIGAPHLGYHVRAIPYNPTALTKRKSDKNNGSKPATIKEYIEDKSHKIIPRVFSKLTKFPKNQNQEKKEKREKIKLSSEPRKSAKVVLTNKTIKPNKVVKRKQQLIRNKKDKKISSGTSINVTVCEEALMEIDSCASDECIEDSDYE